MVAAELGLDPAQVAVVPVDTDLTPGGSGTFGSRAVVAGGGALRRAAQQINAKAVVVAAHLLEAAPRDVIAGGGRFSVRGVHGRSVAWAEVARAAHAPAAAGLSRSSAGLEATASYDPPPAALSNGVHMAMVEVGCDTGQVAVLRYAIAEDCGPLVNPLLVEGQIHGGLA